MQIDIDERVTRASEKYFPELCESNDDPRAELKFADGIEWIRQAAPGSLDIIIVDSTDPVGPAEGLFGVSFYQSCLKALAPDGLLVQQAESPLMHLPVHVAMHAALAEAGFSSTHPVSFPQPVYPSGWWSAIIASRSETLPPQRELQVPQESLQYYRPEMHQAALVVPPFLSRAIASGKV